MGAVGARLQLCCSALYCSAVSTRPLTFLPSLIHSFMFGGIIVWICYFFLFVSIFSKLSAVIEKVLGSAADTALTEVFVCLTVPMSLYPDV